MCLSIILTQMILALFQALYTDTTNCVRVDGSNSEWFPIFSGVRQGCGVAPDLFLVSMDWLMERISSR